MTARTLCQGLGRLKGGFLSRPQEDKGPVNTWLWTSDLQKHTQWSLAVNLSSMVICFASHRNQHPWQSESVSPPVPKVWLRGWSCRTDSSLQALSLYPSSLCPRPTKINLMKFTCTDSPFTCGFCLRLASNGSWGQRERDQSSLQPFLCKARLALFAVKVMAPATHAPPAVSTPSQVSDDCVPAWRESSNWCLLRWLAYLLGVL